MGAFKGCATGTEMFTKYKLGFSSASVCGFLIRSLGLRGVCSLERRKEACIYNRGA